MNTTEEQKVDSGLETQNSDTKKKSSTKASASPKTNSKSDKNDKSIQQTAVSQNDSSDTPVETESIEQPVIEELVVQEFPSDNLQTSAEEVNKTEENPQTDINAQPVEENKPEIAKIEQDKKENVPSEPKKVEKVEKSQPKRQKYVAPTIDALCDVLIVVDMQNDFVFGSLGNEECQKIIPLISQRIAQYKAAEKDVVFTRDTHFGDYFETQEGKKLPVEHCVKDSDGWQIIDSLKEQATTIIDKPSFGSFALASYCIGKRYTGIELVGVCTDICVISNAIILKTALPESTVAVNSLCTAGTSIRAASSAISSMKKCQIDII